MKKLIILMSLLGLFAVACNRENQAGATGSGAGIEREEVRSNEDMNITTPIDDRPELEEERIED